MGYHAADLVTTCARLSQEFTPQGVLTSSNKGPDRAHQGIRLPARPLIANLVAATSMSPAVMLQGRGRPP